MQNKPIFVVFLYISSFRLLFSTFISLISGGSEYNSDNGRYLSRKGYFIIAVICFVLSMISSSVAYLIEEIAKL